MHAGQHDDIGIGIDGLTRECERVARDVGDAVKDLWRHVVVRQDDGIALFLELIDRGDIGRMNRPFDIRNDGLDVFVKLRGGGERGLGINVGTHGSPI